MPILIWHKNQSIIVLYLQWKIEKLLNPCKRYGGFSTVFRLPGTNVLNSGNSAQVT